MRSDIGFLWCGKDIRVRSNLFEVLRCRPMTLVAVMLGVAFLTCLLRPYSVILLTCMFAGISLVTMLVICRPSSCGSVRIDVIVAGSCVLKVWTQGCGLVCLSMVPCKVTVVLCAVGATGPVEIWSVGILSVLIGLLTLTGHRLVSRFGVCVGRQQFVYALGLACID